MFDRQYATRGVAAGIDLDIQLCLWGLIDRWKKQSKELDFLQIFKLSVVNANGKHIQEIVHWQEQPPLKQEAYFEVFKPLNKRLWIIANDDINAVLMFPEEY